MMIRIMDYSDTSNDEIFSRGMTATGLEETVAEIIADVKENGDKALFKYCEKFDNTVTDCLEVSEDEVGEAFDSVDKDLIEVMKKARENIYDYHKHQVKNSFVIAEKEAPASHAPCKHHISQPVTDHERMLHIVIITPIPVDHGSPGLARRKPILRHREVDQDLVKDDALTAEGAEYPLRRPGKSIIGECPRPDTILVRDHDKKIISPADYLSKGAEHIWDVLYTII